MKYLRPLVVLLALAGAPLGPAAAAARAAEAGDLLFAPRAPWALPQGGLGWRLSQQGPEVPGFRPLGEGRVGLEQVSDPSDGKPVLQLHEVAGPIDRRIGPFPVSGGDPALTFFLETTARDMATLTGGSPFYIRNRLKDALFRGGEVRHAGARTELSFAPFRDDPNRDRMFGFDSLEMVFVLDDPHGPIRSMAARTGPLAGGQPPYVSEMVLQ